MHQFNTTKLAKLAIVQTAPRTAHQTGPKPARRSRPIHFNPPVERVRSRKRYRELFRRYGIPNAIDVGNGIFGRTGSAFIDDDDGRIVAYAPPWIASPRRRKTIGLPPVSPGASRSVQTTVQPQPERTP